jgi:hypothetical protein
MRLQTEGSVLENYTETPDWKMLTFIKGFNIDRNKYTEPALSRLIYLLSKTMTLNGKSVNFDLGYFFKCPRLNIKSGTLRYNSRNVQLTPESKIQIPLT